MARLEYYSEPGASSLDGHDQLDLEALSGQPVNYIREKKLILHQKECFCLCEIQLIRGCGANGRVETIKQL